MALKPAKRSTQALRLDPENVRLSHDNPTPKEILLELWERDDILTLVKSIVEKTFLPLENIFITEENGRTVVIEGNRRTAACKLITDPDKLGPQIGRTIRKVIDSNPAFDPASVSKLECIMADTREELNPIMMAKHSGRGFLPWSDWNRSMFIERALKKADGDYEQAASNLKIRKSDVVEAVKMTQMHALSKAVSDDQTASHFEDRKKFYPSTFARIYDSTFVREKLGFDFNPKGEFLCKVDKGEFARAWAKVSSSLASGKLDSRNFNNIESQQKWWDEKFPEELNPKTRLPRALKLKSFDGIKDEMAESGKTKPATKAAKKVKKRKSPNKLIHGDFPDFEDFDTRVALLIGELKSLNYFAYPNVAALGLRCLWDLTIAAYFSKNGRHKQFVSYVVAEGKKKGKSVDPASFKSPSTAQYIGALIDDPITFGLDGLASKAIETLKTNNVFASLNQIVHNSHYAADPMEIQSNWNRLELVVRRLATGEAQQP